MSDRDWREAERAWQADPQDRTKYEAAIAARRRAGVPISGPLLEDLVYPPRTFESSGVCAISCISPARELTNLGQTPGKVEIPAHRAWWVMELTTPSSLSELRKADVCGLYLGGGESAWERVRGLDLELVELEHCQTPPELAGLPQTLTRLFLMASFLFRPDWSHSLPSLPHLTEVWLFDTPLEPITLVALARLPSLRRLHVRNPTRQLRGQVHELLPHCRLASA